MKMKTNDEILATWETEGIYTDWCAIDSYNQVDGTVKRLFVGTEDDCTDMMRAYYIVPTDLALQPFYRCSFIGSDDAKAFFDGIETELSERGVVSATEAAELLGVSRMRVNQLLNDGKLDGFRVGKTWTVYRDSVERRISGK
jgi:excisionase family DNA binding protein